jgi:hypothetical protein
MIPVVNDDLQADFTYEELPTRTFRLIIEDDVITGMVDKLEAMKQAVYLILSIERYQNIIYSWNYGIETLDLYGKDKNFVIPELKRRIQEALLQDTRITNVYNFTFAAVNKKQITASFTVLTIYGEVEAEKVVNV